MEEVEIFNGSGSGSGDGSEKYTTILQQ